MRFNGRDVASSGYRGSIHTLRRLGIRQLFQGGLVIARVKTYQNLRANDRNGYGQGVSQSAHFPPVGRVCQNVSFFKWNSLSRKESPRTGAMGT
jgi:hypothetical protein